LDLLHLGWRRPLAPLAAERLEGGLHNVLLLPGRCLRRCAGPCSLSRADQFAETVWNGPSEAGEVVERMEIRLTRR